MKRPLLRAFLVACCAPWLAQQLGAQSVRLVWDPNPEPEVTGYHVYRATHGSSFRRVTIEPVEETGYVDESALLDAAYVYAVTAVTAEGLESGFSNPQAAYLGPNFAHFVGGGGVGSRLLLQNPHEEAVEGSIAFFGPEGDPLPVALNGEAPTSLVEFSIPRRGILSYATDPADPLTVASVSVEAERRLGGVVLLSGMLGETSTGPSVAAYSAVLPVEWDTAADLQTGLALANPGDVEAQVIIELYDAGGDPVLDDPASFLLAPRGQLSRFPFELFELDLSQWPSFSGTLAVRSSRPLALLGLRLNPRGLVTVPVTPR